MVLLRMLFAFWLAFFLTSLFSVVDIHAQTSSLQLCLTEAADYSPVYPTQVFPSNTREIAAVAHLGATDSYKVSKALEVNPNNAEAYKGRGLANERKGKVEEALSDYNKALELNPKYAEAFNNRGNIYLGKGQPDRAILDFTKALERNPRNADLYSNRALDYYYLKQYDKAWADIRKAQELGSRVDPAFIEAVRAASGKNKD